MKKFLIIILLLILLGGGFIYFTKNEKIEKDSFHSSLDAENEKPVEPYVDDNPIVVGFYKKNSNSRDLVKEFAGAWTYHKDIVELEVYFTNEESISRGNQINLIGEYLAKYDNIDNYRIGYMLNFKIGDKEINQTILSPKDVDEFYDYLEVYLYDDYHRHGEWYSHTTEEQFNEDTLLTSIKLTAGKNIEMITSDITVSVFTYDEDDLVEGIYRGKSKYTVLVKKIL